ncbi:2-dehydropantoate 2-reductase [Lichenicola cladoniae]|uniref:2-dehydropantoate 2-reductase n=1 Tax=Lichenicola cladoniae TaxID=1484109 RepID=A0A6M8HLS5_9PROT|nr:2-dehydropantoate 2-reductase [Lichenicola cladoniae]NPD68953.1 2-dehydropantoate 2-reductase [Acetobacteraceae bacterium]QKE89297.1 2-dehydropantoate 2-reductase [Lichenicola cladoniae]
MIESVAFPSSRLVVLGAGAIGGLAGAFMAQAGHDVLLVDRWAEHVEAINRNGLVIDGVRGPMTIPVRASTPEALEGPLGGVLVATKSQHTIEAVRQILPLLDQDSFIVPFQNGFNEPDIAELLEGHGLGGMTQVIGSIPNYGGALLDPGRIEFVHEGAIQLGEMDGSMSERVRSLAGQLSALTEVQLSTNIWGQIWAKEVYSAQVVFSALVDAPIHETLGVERYARIAGAIVREALEIAEANRIVVEPFNFFDPANYRPQIPEDTHRLLDNIKHAIWLLKKDQNTGYVFKKKGSGIWWDIVYRNRPSEVRASNGKLVEYGRRVGADTRLNDRMCSMIYEIESGSRSLGLQNYDELEAYAAEIGRALP